MNQLCNLTYNVEYIYLLQLREFTKTKENIYKVGMTKKDNLKRFNQYPKGSILLFQMICDNSRNTENKVIKLFREKFTQHKEIGNEYFEGDYKEMIDIIYSVIINKKEEDNYENDDEESTIQVKTYDEWIKNNKIKKIIITNKNGEGYLRFTEQLWRKLYDEKSEDFNYNTQECLSLFIQKYHPDNYCDVEYDNNEIMKDTIEKCYSKNPDFYNLSYNEYVLSTNSESIETKYVILNSLTFTFTSIEELISDKILTDKDCGSRTIYAKNIINTEHVDNILNSLISEPIKRHYKKLVYNILVKQEESPIIFYDYNECLLMEWLKDILYTISDYKFFAYSSDYYDDKLKFKKLLKINNYRCIIITKNINALINNQINTFLTLGFKNIIICQNDPSNNIYNIKNFTKYLYDNQEILMNCIKEENNYEIRCWTQEIQHFDNIFYRSQLLLTNFLKWCCIK